MIIFKLIEKLFLTDNHKKDNNCLYHIFPGFTFFFLYESTFQYKMYISYPSYSNILVRSSLHTKFALIPISNSNRAIDSILLILINYRTISIVTNMFRIHLTQFQTYHRNRCLHSRYIRLQRFSCERLYESVIVSMTTL